MKILVVDDEVSICELLDEYLSMHGYQVITAGNGQDAISKFEADRPHMVLLDLSMPGMSGMDVLRKIREIDANAGIIVLSAFGDVNTVQEAVETGANFYTQKPIEFDRLLKILIAWDSSQNNLSPRQESREIRGSDAGS